MEDVGILYVQLVYFMVVLYVYFVEIWYILWLLYIFPEKNLATLLCR
jgi:hypothetical protein